MSAEQMPSCGVSAQQMASCGVHQTGQSANRGLREWHTAAEGRRWGGGLGAKTGDHCRPNVLMETNSGHVNAKCASQQPMYVCTSFVRSPYFHSNFRSEGEIGPGDIRGSKPSTYTAENGAAPIKLGLSTRLHTYIRTCSNI